MELEGSVIPDLREKKICFCDKDVCTELLCVKRAHCML